MQAKGDPLLRAIHCKVFYCTSCQELPFPLKSLQRGISLARPTVNSMPWVKSIPLPRPILQIQFGGSSNVRDCLSVLQISSDGNKIGLRIIWKCTLTNPMSEAFSLKHWRQMLRPYLRMRPALWVQTRLEELYISNSSHCGATIFSSSGGDSQKNVPRTGALAIGSGPWVPNRFVRHIDGIEVVGGGG